MTLLKWLRRLAGTLPDTAKPVRQATIQRASNEHTRGAGDLVKAARKSLSVSIERDLSGRHGNGHGAAD